MKIEDQVCTLEQAKMLSELGVVQGLSIFFYDEFREGIVYNNNPVAPGYFNAESCFSAFTVAQLGMMLPTGFDTMRLTVSVNGNEKWKPYNDDDEDILGTYTFYDTEAEARAAMLIYLIKSNVVTVDEVNNSDF